ncbi:MAG: leucine-rich repeat domain-containing protein [Clostridia bacterium]|nr:leucine-rich repeat domain-containing protein [Clostridia bacterium]
MKTWKWLIVTVVMMIAMLCVGAAAADASGTDGNISWNLVGSELTISGTGDMNNYTLENPAPWANESFESVVIEDGVTSIGDGAFFQYESIASIWISKDVTSIGLSAFYDCINLSEITIPRFVTNIGNNAFSGCTSLTSITIPDGVTSINFGVFGRCSNLTSITIPQDVTAIDMGAFFDCTSLTDVYYNGTEEEWAEISINTSANDPLIAATKHFAEEQEGISWSVSDGVLTITGTGAMDDYTYDTPAPWANESFSSVVIEDGVTSIGNYAFEYSTSMTSISIPDSVSSIGMSAFFGCRSLTDITLPEGMISIRAYLFYDCSSLTDITIPNSVTTIENDVFGGSGLNSITIPENVTSIDHSAFSHCSSLTEIIVDPANETYSSNNGVLFNKNKTALLYYPDGKPGTSYTVPDSVTSIGYCAFNDCANLASVTIPESVTFIQAWAFQNCSFTSITLPEGVEVISSWVFWDCSSLTSITIPSSVETIYNGAFDGCTSLTDVYYNGTEEEWSGISIATDGNDALTAATKHFAEEQEGISWSVSDGVLTITGTGDMPDYSYGQEPWKDLGVTSAVIKDGVTRIGNGAFSGCTSLTEISIADSVTGIGNSAFSFCKSLTEITIPDSVTSLGQSVFSACSGLTGITIPKNVTNIGPYIFGNCINLASINVDPESDYYTSDAGVLYNKEKTELVCYPAGKEGGSYTVPSGVTVIAMNAFDSCSSLTFISIPYGVTILYDGTFNGCTNLYGVYIPDSVNTIGDYAFTSCGNVTFYCSAFSEAHRFAKAKPMNYSLISAQVDLHLPANTTTIESEAFAGLPEDIAIYVPATVTSIADNAFDEGVVLVTPAGSPAAQWANDHFVDVVEEAAE